MTVSRYEHLATPSPGPASLVAWAEAAQAAHQLAVPLCRTDFVPKEFRGNENAATAAILYGTEVGLSPMQALQGIFVIGGRPAMYARTMLAVTLGAGHKVWTEESTDARAIVCAQRRDGDTVEKVVVTIDQAKRAGWTSNKKYQSEPAAMLLARAQSQACRRIAPDALLGVPYSAEELEDDQTTEVPAKRTAKRTTPAALPAPEPDIAPPTPEPAALGEVIDGLIPEPDPEPDPEPVTPFITDAQSKKLHALLRESGLSGREDGLRFLTTSVGRQVTSSKDLTKDEASKVIDGLEKATEPDVDDWPPVPQPGGAT